MGKKQDLPKLTVAEFEIMKVIWEQEEASAATILSEINKLRLNELNRSTIRVQVARLIDKGWITSVGTNRSKRYKATVPRGRASSLIADDVKDRVFNGSTLELIRTLFKSSEVSGEEMAEIRRLLDDQEK